MDIASKRQFFVLGMARSGIAVARLLAMKGFAVTVFDDKSEALVGAMGSPELEGLTSVGATTRNDVLADLVKSDCLVISPGVPMDHPIVVKAKADGIEIAGELEVAYHFCTSRIIGVTGTNGKSTVVSIIGRILDAAGVSSAVAGNIGTPLSAIVESDHRLDTVVLEISSFQLDTIADFRSDVAVLLNVTPDHLDRYGDSFEAYTRSKARILNRMGNDGCFVYNNDDAACRDIAADFRGERIPFSSSEVLAEGVFAGDGSIVRHWHGRTEAVMPIKEFSPVGIHNLENAMAAVAAVTPLGIALDTVCSALRSYRPLPHRMELVRIVGGVAYIDDSKATNVDATIKSLRSIEGPTLLILGGLDKNGDFRPMLEHLTRVKKAILIGAARDKIASVLKGHVELADARTMGDAVRQAAESAESGDTVLLAPACASFDMFRDYKARGEAFRDAVNSV